MPDINEVSGLDKVLAYFPFTVGRENGITVYENLGEIGQISKKAFGL